MQKRTTPKAPDKTAKSEDPLQAQLRSLVVPIAGGDTSTPPPAAPESANPKHSSAPAIVAAPRKEKKVCYALPADVADGLIAFRKMLALAGIFEGNSDTQVVVFAQRRLFRDLNDPAKCARIAQDFAKSHE